MTAKNEPLKGLVVKLSELAWRQQKIEDESRALKAGSEISCLRRLVTTPTLLSLSCLPTALNF